MAIISSKNFLEDEYNERKDNEYKLPSLILSKSEYFSFPRAMAYSVGLHIVIPLLACLISLILTIMGISLFKFDKVKLQNRDIEFVLVDKQATPRDLHTKNRSDMNSRSGGVNDPKRKVSLPSPQPQKIKKPSSAANNANKIIKKQQQQQIVNQAKKVVSQPKQDMKPSVKEVQSPAKPAPPTARPSARPVSAPAPVAKPTSKFAAPIPQGAISGKSLSTGPVGGTNSGASKYGASGRPYTASSAGTYAPRPSLAPSASGGGGALSRGGYSGGNGSVGNPGGGGGAPGIDALREPDFGPYMRELQNRIKRNWEPPKGNESKTVVLLFKIAKDGRLLSCRVSRSSGLQTADSAALRAVELTAPFRPLPPDFKGQSIDIQFTFDYRVFSASRY